MKLIWYLILLSPIVALGQDNYINLTKASSPGIDHYIQSFNEVDGLNTPVPDISSFLEKLEERDSPKRSMKFCKTLFHKTRQQFLRHYSPYATFGETLNAGKYNCLTGTALYALLLDHFGIPYTITETNYHIFLVANTAEGQALFEATDPAHGFVTGPQQIQERIQQYKSDAGGAPIDGKNYYTYEVSLFHQVNLKELQGLLHYNLSIDAYNQTDFLVAIHHLGKAIDLYNSPRIAEFSKILLMALLESKLDEETKGRYIGQVQILLKKRPVMAYRSAR